MYTSLVALVTGTLIASVHCVDAPVDDRPVAPTSGALTPGAQPSRLVARYVVLQGPGAIAAARAGADGVPRARLDAAARKRVGAHAAELRSLHAALRPRLEALGATVIEDVVLVANAFQIVIDARALPDVAKLPGVARLGAPTVLSPALWAALPLIGVPTVWESDTGYHGEGMRIGLIDSGVDYTHASLGGAGDPALFTADDHTVVEPGSFPTAKVIGGVDLVGDDYDATGLHGSVIPAPDDDPIDCLGHGTAVASVAAGVGSLAGGDGSYGGPWDTSLDPLAFAVYPGAAPAASIYIYKIFGCQGGGGLLMSALELAADPDEDDDPLDRLDVVNLSVGSPFALAEGVESSAFTALRDAGSLVVAAAGNDTRADFTLGFPASEPSVLAVGGTLRDEQHNVFLALVVTAPSDVASIYPVVQPTTPPEMPALEGEAVVADPVLGCEPLANAAALSGKIAILRRGSCGFSVKAQNAADAGAVAAIIVDNTYNDFPPGNSAEHPIPVLMLRLRDGDALIAAAPLSVSFNPEQTTEIVVPADYAYAFSSAGPTADALLLKPDLAAPGSVIECAAAGSGWDGAPQSGTSLSSPMVAGGAALLRQARPTLDPATVAALLTSTARPVANAQGEPFPTVVSGSGRLALADALGADITARVAGSSGAIGVSFGVVLASAPRTETRTVVVENHGADAVTLDLALEPGMAWPGMTVALLVESVDVAAGGTASFELSLTVDPAALPPAPAYNAFQFPNFGTTFGGNSVDAPNVFFTAVSGRVVLTRRAGLISDAVVAYYGIGRAAAERTIGAVAGCVGADSGALTLTLAGTPASHDNATSVLELGSLASSKSGLTGNEAMGDIVAVGAFADPASGQAFFGVASAADWPSPALGALSVVALEIDTDDDQVADFMVTAESFIPNAFVDDPLSLVFGDAPFARVVDLASEALNETHQPLNTVLAAYPGGVFFGKQAYETGLYFNRVAVFPVALSDLGLDAAHAALSYRAISFTSRIPLLIDQPLPEPLDTSDWVAFDAGAPKIALPGCLAGTPLCPGDGGSIAIDLPQGASEPPTLLVFHHTNGAAPRYETFDLADAERFTSDLAVTGGEGGGITPSQPAVTDFTVTNTGATGRAGVSVTVSGGIQSLATTAGTCGDESCALGSLAAGASVTITATGRPTAGPIVDLVATVSSSPACESDTSNDSASVRFTIQPDVVEPTVEPGPEAQPEAVVETQPETQAETVAEAEATTASGAGCGCGSGSHPDAGAGFAALAMVLANLALRRRRTEAGQR